MMLIIQTVAVDILGRKISTYEKFNASFPGFGGFMPWVVIGSSGIVPDAPYWSNQVSFERECPECFEIFVIILTFSS